MPEIIRLSEVGFAKGENSKDSPTELADGEWSELINIEPGADGASVRGGIPLKATLSMDGIDWIFPFRSTGKKKWFIGKRGVDLVQFDSNGSAGVIMAGAFPTVNVKACAERVADSVIVACDYPSGRAAIAVSMSSDKMTLVAEPANISRPTGTTISIEYLDPRSPEGINAEGVELPVNSCRMVAVTFVRRRSPDADAFDSSGRGRTTDAFADAVAESWEDMSERAYFQGIAAIQTPFGQLMSAKQKVTIAIPGAIPRGCTHVRLWATQSTMWLRDDAEGGALAVAAGSGLRFLMDIAVAEFGTTGIASVVVNKTDGELAGQLNLSDTIGANDIPPARQIKYHNGRLWATGAKFGDSPGRSYYSKEIVGSPLRSLSLFSLSDQYTDTSIDDTEATMGMASSRGNLFFINQNDVWILRDGNPSETNPPGLIAQGLGTSFPGTISENGQLAFYLSNLGPAVISGETVDLMEDFKVGSVWPKTYSGVGYFFQLDRIERLKVKSFWFGNTWYITDGLVTAAFRVEPGKGGAGYRVEPAAGADLRIEHFAKHDEGEAYILSGSKLCSWMSTKRTRDGVGFYFTAKAKTRGMRIDGRRRWKMGEAWDVLVLSRWQDVGEMLITLEGQFGRVGDLFRYTERTLADPLQAYQHSSAYREAVQQIVPAYRLSAWFMAGIQKVIRGEFDISGIQVGYMPREGTEFEYISVADAETIPTPDAALAIFDDRFNSGEDG